MGNNLAKFLDSGQLDQGTAPVPALDGTAPVQEATPIKTIPSRNNNLARFLSSTDATSVGGGTTASTSFPPLQDIAKPTPDVIPPDMQAFLNRPDKSRPVGVSDRNFFDSLTSVNPEPRAPITTEEFKNIAQNFARTSRTVLEVGAPLAVSSILTAVTDNPITVSAAGASTYTLASSVSDLIDRAVGLKKPITNLQELGRDITGTATVGAATELLGLGIPAGGKAIAKGIKVGASAIGRGVKRKLGEVVVKKAAAQGIDLSLAEVTGSSLLQLGERLFENAPLTAGFLRKFRLKQLQSLVNRRSQLLKDQGDPIEIEKVGLQIMRQMNEFLKKNTKVLTAENTDKIRDLMLKKLGANARYIDIGNEVFKIIDDSSRVVRKEANRLYRIAGRFIPKTSIVDTKPLQKVARRFLKEELALLPSTQNTGLIAVLTDLGGRKATAGAEAIAPKALNYQSLDIIRQRFNDVVQANTAVFGKNTGELATSGNAIAGKYKTLVKGIITAMEKHAKPFGAEARKANAKAKRFWLKWVENTFRDEKLLKMRADAPELFNKLMFDSENLTQLRIFKRALGRKGFKSAKRAFFKNVLESGDIGKEIGRFRKEVLDELLTPAELKKLVNLDEAIKAPKFTTVITEREIIENPLFKSLLDSLEKNPQQVLNLVIKPGNTEIIKFTRKVVGEKAFNTLKVAFTEKLMEINAAGFFSPAKFVNRLHSFGDATLQAIYNEKELTDIRNLAEVASLIKGALKEVNNNTLGVSKKGLGVIFTKARKRATSIPLTAPLITAGARTLVSN